MDISAELWNYVAKQDRSYRWEKVQESRNGAVRRIDLILFSQIWQGIPWQHLLVLYVPDTIEFPNMALLGIHADGSGFMGHVTLGEMLAAYSGMICAFLYDVPNQPLFDDLIEDGLIAHTLVQYLDTQDSDWPLLFPMTKSAVRAMDAVQEIAHAEGWATPAQFMVTGYSKRGWTTWLTGVVDSRVAGIAPMVFDNLNIMAQMPHQQEVFDEGYSEQISDYTEAGLMERMMTPLGFHLAQIIDPYTYRERLTQPKVIFNGANDRYWATDALNLYWDGLPEPKYIVYVPNARHNLDDPDRVYSAYLAFAHRLADGKALPLLNWFVTETPEVITLTVISDTPVKQARLWSAVANGRDFRESLWEERPMADGQETEEIASLMDARRRRGAIYVQQAEVARPETGYRALFGELEFAGPPTVFGLSTQIHIAHGLSPGNR